MKFELFLVLILLTDLTKIFHPNNVNFVYYFKSRIHSHNVQFNRNSSTTNVIIYHICRYSVTFKENLSFWKSWYMVQNVLIERRSLKLPVLCMLAERQDERFVPYWRTTIIRIALMEYAHALNCNFVWIEYIYWISEEFGMQSVLCWI